VFSADLSFIEDFSVNVILKMQALCLWERRMLSRTFSGIILTLLLGGILTSTFTIQLTKASGAIHIYADGIDPQTHCIERNGDAYTFTCNVYDTIVVHCSDIVIDGANHTLEGTGSGTGIAVTTVSGYMNVTIKNLEIKDFAVGIDLHSFNKGVISGNTITNNGDGIQISGFGQFSSYGNIVSGNVITDNENGIIIEGAVGCNVISGNTIMNNGNYGIALITWMPLHSPATRNIICGNTITNNSKGIYLSECSNNRFYHNNFVNNDEQAIVDNAANFWDDGYPSGGNYWSDYAGVDGYQGARYEGADQSVLGGDGIGDISYVIDANNTDFYPLMKTWDSPPPSPPKLVECIFPKWLLALLFLLAVLGGANLVVIVGFVLWWEYERKKK